MNLMKLTDDFILTLSDPEKWQIIRGYELCQQQGILEEDTPFIELFTRFLNTHQLPNMDYVHSIVMCKLYASCLKYFLVRYIEFERLAREGWKISGVNSWLDN